MKNVARAKEKVGLWQFLTVFFAALFVLAVFTDTFDFGQDASSGQEADEGAGSAASGQQTGLEESGKTTSPKPVEAAGIANLEFYVMSQCPYGLQVEDAIYPVLKSLGNNVNFSLYFIATENADGTFRSLHGQPEVDGDIVQVCAIEHEPESYMDLINCMNRNANQIPGNWEACSEELGLDTEAIRECFEGEEGKELFRKSIERSEDVGATGSPTIYLNGQMYNGGRSETDFTRALCDALEYQPAACQELPEPVKVNAYIINDKRCGECDVAILVQQLNSIFPGLAITEYEYTDADGRAFYEKVGVKYLPAILFDDSVKDGEGYDNVRNYLEEYGDYYNLRIGSSFDPTTEICDNGKDDTGNGKVDCEDDDCAQSMVCREEKPENLQVFIMSDCPYGTKAVEALKEVRDNFGSLDFEVHYIASEMGDGFASLHGDYEVDENIVQLCALEHSPGEWFDYLYCRSTKGIKDIDWKECAEETGVDIEAVEACFEGEEGKELLREDIKIANSLNIGASPTWLANNKYTFSGIDAETVKSSFCQYNPDIEGCENTLSSDTGGVPEGSC